MNGEVIQSSVSLAGPVEGCFLNSLMQTLRSGKVDLVSSLVRAW